tara:strand:- start:19586 stop:19723 length:138 start_codon:yes stop_codon:yes gene_type:complete
MKTCEVAASVHEHPVAEGVTTCVASTRATFRQAFIAMMFCHAAWQ